MYADFFDPPPGMSMKQAPVGPNAGKVRFHEEVKVKKIKPKGKGLPVNTPAYWAEEIDGEGLKGLGGEDGMVNGRLDLDQDHEVDSEEDQGDDDDEDSDGDESDDVEDDDDDEDSEEDDQEVGQKGRQAVERLKDDLFADEGGEEEPGEGGSDGSSVGYC